VTARLVVRLLPRAGVDRVDGVGEGGELRARVAAAPVDGAANEALRRLLAEHLGIAPRLIRLVAGAAGRRKIVEVDVEAAVIEAAWPGVSLRGR